MKPSVAVCVPYRGSFYPQFMLNTWLPIYEEAVKCKYGISTFQADIYASPLWFNDAPDVSVSRNDLAQAALDRNVDYILWLDSDVVFRVQPLEAVKMLLEDSFDLVSGVYLLKNLHCISAFIKLRTIPFSEVKDRIVRVDGVGMGCLLMKTEVLENVKYPWFKRDSRLEMGEDVGFCYKSRRKGYKIFLDGRVVLDHIGVNLLRVEDEDKSLFTERKV